MVLVDGVVTVDRIAADHVAEPDEQLDALVLAQLDDVLARELDASRLHRDAVAAEDAEFLEVDVQRMLPASGRVHEDPPLELVALRAEAERRAVHELAVHLPAAVAALEAERPRDPRRGRADVGQ